jgi:hypothetical protein
MRNKPDDCYTDNEILASFHALTDEEIAQLQSFARYRLMGKTGRYGHVEVGDLFIDAAIRTMEGKRSWTRGVSRFNHLFAVMRSIGCQRFKQAARQMPLDELVAAPQHWSLSALDAQASVARLKEQLRGDVIALNILDSMMSEMRPRDTQRFLGISAEVYWAARKRIRRQAENLRGAPLPGGARALKRPSPSGAAHGSDESQKLNALVPMP